MTEIIENNASLGSQLRQATISGDLEAVVALLDDGVEPDAEDNYGFTALMLAAKYGHAEIARVLLERGADVNRYNHFVRTALHLAIQAKQPEVLPILIQAGANVNPEPKVVQWVHELQDWHLIHEAIGTGNTAVVKILLDAGTELNPTLRVETDTRTSLGIAVTHRDARMVKFLLSRGAPISPQATAGDGRGKAGIPSET